VLQTLIVLPVAEWTARHRFGLAQITPVPAVVRTLLAVVLLDYTLWFWHFANHKVPFLWRFHLVHHVDRDLDSSTALRFHFGEMALSMPYRAFQVLVAGADPLALWLFGRQREDWREPGGRLALRPDARESRSTLHA
jgi:sterol desaturase/sphingolipid hydroxylase (fatty acid hydroxylase superfamily)